MNELKACQCGGFPECDSSSNRYRVECQFCGMNTGWCDTKEDAVNSWNTRPEEERLQARIDELESKIKQWRTYG